MSHSDQYLYFIVNHTRSHVKIGVSNNPWARLYDLQAGNPDPLVIELTLRARDRTQALNWEDALHQHFAAYWHQREWFEYAPALRDYVAQWRQGRGSPIARPAHTCKQFVGPHGRCLSKDEYLADLRAKAAA